jgi:hypothetical protein
MNYIGYIIIPFVLKVPNNNLAVSIIKKGVNCTGKVKI